MKNKNVVFQTLSLISQLGISMIAPILLCTVLGVFLENKFSLHVTIPCIVAGVLAGGRNVYALVRHMKETIAEQKDDAE